MASRKSTPEPLSVVLRREMAERRLTLRALSDLTKEVDRRGLSLSYIGELAKGTEKALSEASIEVLAETLEIDPMGIAEYRLAMARRALDPRQVGYDDALRALARFESALGKPSARTAPPARVPVPDSLKRRAAGGPPTPEDQPAAPATRAARSARRTL